MTLMLRAHIPRFYDKLRCLLPPANEVWGKVIFLHLSIILFTGGGRVVFQHALQVVSQHALQVFGGEWWYPSLPCRWYPSMPCMGGPGPHPGGKLRGLTRGISRPTPGGSPGPHPGGCVSQHTLRQTPLLRGRLLPRAVRILLECILVLNVLCFQGLVGRDQRKSHSQTFHVNRP